MSRFIAVLKDDQIESDIEERRQRAKPWNSYHTSKDIPLCILYPESTDDVSRIMTICNELCVPVVAYGGGTSLEGHTLPVSTSFSGPISLDFSRMNSIVEFHEDDLDITVQAGLGYVQLNDFLRSKGIWVKSFLIHDQLLIIFCLKKLHSFL